MIFLSRLKRVIKKISVSYRENDSFSLTLSYVLKILNKKLFLLCQHLYGARHTFRPAYRAAKKQRLIEAHKQGRAVLALCVAGGVGDLLVMARFIRDMHKEAGGFSYDIFCAHPVIARWIFANVLGFVHAEYDTALRLGRLKVFYDAEFHLNQGVKIVRQSKNLSRLSSGQFSKILQNIGRSAKDLRLYIDNQPFLDNALGRVAVYSNASRRDFLHHIAGVSYGGDLLQVPCTADVLERFSLHGRQWITVHNGFDTNFIVGGERATKCYPHFDRVLEHIKRLRPDIFIIQIGTSSSIRLLNADLDLISKTNLEEATALLQGSTLHLDNESGLVHLASCLGTRSVVVFGPTPSDYFGYPTNININPTFCGGCWWINELWMDRCPRQFEVAECLQTIDPERIAVAFLEAFGRSEPLTVV